MQTILFAGATANTSQMLTYLHKSREHNQYTSLILAYGTANGAWSGTLAFYISPDSGTTKIPLTSSPGGTGITLTANGMAVITLGTPNTNFATQQLQIWVTQSGATTPNITVSNYDNND